MDVTVEGMNTELKEALWKACCPMLVTPSGMVTEVNFEQSWNIYSPMVVTPFSNVAVVNEPQEAKALLPIELTLLGMVIEVKAVPLKQLLPNVVTPAGKLMYESKEQE